jgi:plastocyanin
MRPAKRSIRVIYTLLIGLAIAGLLAACGSSSSDNNTNTAASKPNQGNSNDTSVAIQGFKFVPADLTVPKGTTVVWTNNDSATHNATSGSDWATKNLTKGQNGSVTLDKAGTFNYICTIHPSMKGKITVTG